MLIMTKEYGENLTNVYFSGDLNCDDLISYISKNIYDFNKIGVIWDFSKSDFSFIVSDEWRTVPQRLKIYFENNKNSKLALTSENIGNFGMLRMFDMASDMTNFPIQVKSFKNIDSAKAWISSIDL